MDMEFELIILELDSKIIDLYSLLFFFTIIFYSFYLYLLINLRLTIYALFIVFILFFIIIISTLTFLHVIFGYTISNFNIIYNH